MATFLDLAKKLERKADRLGAEANAAKIAAATAFLTDVVAHTPVDTAEHVSSWEAGLDTPPPAHREPFALGDAEGSAQLALAAAKRVLRRCRPGQTVYLSNAAPAIRLLNDGSSQKEPAGFVERALLKARLSLRNYRGEHGRR